jgi:glycosyltransferase involved in cell wall biosynthesis
MKNDSFPLVTIITPVYNGEEYIKEVIESILNQDYPNIEYLILDDGSQDRTPEILKNFSEKIKIIRHSNIGESRTVNKGFKLANGEYIGVVNSDDPILPKSISKIISEFQNNRETQVVYPDYKIIDEKNNLIRIQKTHDYNYSEMVARHQCTPGPCAFFKKSLVEKIGGRDPTFKYVSDFDFWLRGGLIGPFKRIPEVIATYRIHSLSATESKKGREMAKEHIRLMDKYFSMEDIPKDILSLKKEAYSSAYYTAAYYCGDDDKISRFYYYKALKKRPLLYLTKYRPDRLPIIIKKLIDGLPFGIRQVLNLVFEKSYKLWLKLKKI